MCNQLKIQQTMCGIHSSSHGTVHDGSWWHWKSQCASCISGNDPDVNIYWFLRQYLTPGAIWGLYVRLGDTPEATRSFLVDITPSRVVFSANLVPRDPWDNSELCVRARSLVMRLLPRQVFWRRVSLVSLANGLIWRLRRGSSPRVSESVKNWPL